MSPANLKTSRPGEERSAASAIVPTPRCAITIRAAAAADLPFIDQLQKMHSHMVGWFPTKQIEKNIEAGNVLIAEEQSQHGTEEQSHHGEHREGRENGSDFEPSRSPLPKSSVSSVSSAVNRPLGYIIFRDQYMKRDDVGIIYQLNVLPLRQRKLIGASLVKACFEKAAYGCRLYCCWCAQDILANFFWESVGFLPLAFRTGSRGKQRTHIFWERRVREGDDSTPYWFPSQTAGGSLREDRLVLPIPDGLHWRDVMPQVLPNVLEDGRDARAAALPEKLPGGSLVRPRPEQPKVSRAQRMAVVRSKSRHLQGLPPGKAAVVTAGGIRYIERGDHEPEPEPAKVKRPRKPAAKFEEKYVKAARELRDRYLEQVNTGRLLPESSGKYDVGRALGAGAEAVQPDAPSPIQGYLPA